MWSKWLERYKTRIQDIPEMLQRISTLLKEGYTLHESIEIILPFHTTKDSYWRGQIQTGVKDGETAVGLFKLLGLESKNLLIIQIAEQTGTLPQVLEKLGQELEVQAQAKQKTTRALFYPLFLFTMIFVMFLLFRQYFLPNMEQMLGFRNDLTVTIGSLQLSKLFLRLPDTILFIGCICFGVLVLAIYLLSKKSVAFQIRVVLALPIIRYYWRLLITKEFAFLLGRLLAYGWSIQDALNMIREQKLHKQLSYIATEIEKRILYGDHLSDTVQLYDYFFVGFERFILHGEKIGKIGEELLIYADLLGRKFNRSILTVTKIVQPLMLLVVALCVIAAYLSILLPVYNMLDIV